MGSRNHPLDVFRASGDGFEKATRQRRTLPGKVLASSVRSKLAAPRAGGAKPARATSPRKRFTALFSMSVAKRRSGPASRADGATRTMFYGAVALLALVALVVVIQRTFSDGGLPELPVLKKEEALPAGPVSEKAAPAPEWYTIQASRYNGSENGLELAFAAQQELIVRGFPNVTVIGHETPGSEGEGLYESFELIVGTARTLEALEGDLQRLQAIDDWPGGKAAPFVDCRTVAHPSPPE